MMVIATGVAVKVSTWLLPRPGTYFGHWSNCKAEQECYCGWFPGMPGVSLS